MFFILNRQKLNLWKEATQDLKEINLPEFSKEATDAVENINQNGECDKEELIRVSNELFAGVNQVFRGVTVLGRGR